MSHLREPFPDRQRVLKWVSLETVLSVLVMLVGLGAVYGSLRSELVAVSSDVAELKAQSRSMTPQAASEIASIHATDRAIQQQVVDPREAMRAQRVEIRETMERIEQKLDDHDDPRR